MCGIDRDDPLTERQIEQPMYLAEVLGNVGGLHAGQVLKLIPVGDDVGSGDFMRFQVAH